jgi:hypothetical protein
MAKHMLVRSGSLIGVMLLGGCPGGSGTTALGSSGSSLQAAHAASVARLATVGERVVFISGLGAGVAMYPADIYEKNPPLFGDIRQGVTRADGLWVDTNHVLYVSNDTTPPSIVEYKRGASEPFKTITNGLFIPGAVAVDSSGNLYVADFNGYENVILVYPSGSGSPSRSVPVPNQGGGRSGLGSLAFDPRGDLLVATFNVERNTGAVYSIAPGSSVAVNLNLAGLPGDALGTDAAGNIYAGGFEGDISVFAPGAKRPARFITAGGQTGFYSDFAVTPDGKIYWPNYDLPELYEFAPGASSPTNVVQGGGGVDAAVGPR